LDANTGCMVKGDRLLRCKIINFHLHSTSFKFPAIEDKK